jgi:hypothetical protein
LNILSIGTRSRRFRVVESYLTHATELWEGLSQNIPGGGAKLLDIGSGRILTPATATPSDSRFIMLRRTGAEVVMGYVDIEDE